jgi:probable F420-dependent oxidoreductase
VISLNITGIDRVAPGGIPEILDHVRHAEDVGVGEVVVAEHAIISADGPNNTPYPADQGWPDPFVLLTAVALATENARLATNIAVAALRPAIVLAKTAATLDVVSSGRLDLGVGSGWQANELQAAGLPFTDRVRLMVDTVRACQALWTGAPASFKSETVSFCRVWSRPAPLQAGGIPIWFAGGPSAATMRRIAEYGVGWTAPARYDDEELRRGTALLHEAFLAAGRDPSTAECRASITPRAAGQRIGDIGPRIASLADAGVTRFSVYLEQFAQAPEDVPRLIDELASLVEHPNTSPT